MTGSAANDVAIASDLRCTLPPSWRWCLLGDHDVCEINPSRPVGFVRGDDEPTSFIPMTAVSERSGTISAASIRPYGEVKRGYTFVREGDVLFSKITPCMQNGKHAMARSLTDGVGFASTEFHVVRPGSKVHADWVHYFLRQPAVLKSAARSFNGSAGQQRVPPDFLRALEVPVPPIAEQLRVLSILSEQLSAVERARAAAEAQVEAAKALPAAYLRRVFEGATAQTWPKRTLAEMSEIVGGIQKSPDRVPVRLHRPYLTVRNVQRGCLDLSEVERFEVTPAEIERLRLVSGDILVVEGNGSIDQIGRNAMFVADGQEWIHQNHVIRVRLDGTAWRPEFVSCFLNSDLGRAQMVKKAETTSGLYTLSAGKVASLEVPVPSLGEQESILSVLTERMGQVERLVGQAGEQLTGINSLPAALLRRAFSGEL
jgi:type I restriction enzyme S subunit